MYQPALPIGVAQTPRGILISLPPRFWLVVSLRRNFRTLQAEPEAWTYRVPDPRAAVRVERWMAEAELRLRAEARRRAWTAMDTEWLGRDEAAPSLASAAALSIGRDLDFTLPAEGLARSTRTLLARMAAGEVLVVTVTALAGRLFCLSPSGRTVMARVAEAAIGAALVVPAGDGLFGPESSQTWRLAREDAADAHRP